MVRLVFIALLLGIAYAAILIIFSSQFRYMWDMPLCAYDGKFSQITFTWTVLNHLGLLCAKTATLLLFNELFTVVSTRMRWAIRIGHAANVITYTTSIGVFVYCTTPRIGRTWDNFIAAIEMDTLRFAVFWTIAQGAAGVLLDIYIFILPLPVVLRLKLSTRRRIQLIAIFFTALLGVVASIVSLVYRVRILTETDRMWEGGAIVNCNFVEMNVATIIASAPGFAKFMRRHVLESKLVKSLRSTLGRGSASSSAEKRNPNQPRTGRDDSARKRGPNSRYCKLGDGGLLQSQVSVTEGEVSPEHDVLATTEGDGWLKAASSPV
ncbi:hypothetical protein OCS_04458 [Ophiocordyceps sinensis CO18]|uniref:Rhodopsin domain-containing protein n=1 Tax=Ophiocordyceps sinensis (strain Co18 / CGMCC 3.14243) TaxID=911162 RepID=T5AB66_OPHSC|nr:hypothetical protein OCS_04458 [Ophiocordyceps sinensis CO18]